MILKSSVSGLFTLSKRHFSISFFENFSIRVLFFLLGGRNEQIEMLPIVFLSGGRHHSQMHLQEGGKEKKKKRKKKERKRENVLTA